MAIVKLDTVDLRNDEFQQYLNDQCIEAIVIGNINGNDEVQYSADRQRLEIMIEKYFDSGIDSETQYLKSFIID